MRYDELSDEQRAMLEGGSTPEEMLRLAQAEGYKLSDEELEQVVGGFAEWIIDPKCPRCGASGYHEVINNKNNYWYCDRCGFRKNNPAIIKP